MDDLHLRKAAATDSEFAFRARRAAYKQHVDEAGGWDEQEQRQLHERRFAIYDYRIVQRGGVDVGIVAVAVSSECLNVNQLFILPEHQGKGVGRECMLRIIDEASRLRLPVRLDVLKVNPRARAFYERLGFVLTGQTETHELMEKAQAAPA